MSVAVALSASLGCAGAGGGDSAAASAQTPGDSAAVASVVGRYHTALADGDTATAMTLLGPEAVVLESGGLESRQEYRDHHLPADMEFARSVTHERGPVAVRVVGEVAWAWSTSGSVGRFREREIDALGAELMVLRRAPEGWRIEAIHWSSRSRARP